MIEFIAFCYFGFALVDDFFEAVLLFIGNTIVWVFTVFVIIFVSDFMYKTDYQESLPLINKEYQDGYFYTTMAGKVPVTNYMPEQFNLDLGKLSCSVSKDLFNSSFIGDDLTVEWYEGLSDAKYCTNVFK